MITNTSGAECSPSATANIQIVDDNPENMAVLSSILTKQGYEVRTAITGTLALKSARKHPPDLFLLDIMMPEMNGYEICEQLKADERTRDIPVIFLSALDEMMDKVKAFAVGGVDYIAKPFETDEVLARIEIHLSLWRLQKRLEEQNAQLQGEIDERLRVEQVLREATHDLGERVKELNCLYGISRLVVKPGISMDEILQGTAELIPPSWQYPQIIFARISLDEREFATRNYNESPWKLTADIFVHGEKSGMVQVGYLQEMPQSDEGPFLKEERDLINAIAVWLGRTIERKQAEEALQESEERWRSLTEASPDHILTLDMDLNIQFVNYTSPGLTKEELMGMTLYTFVEDERQEEIKAILEGVLKIGTPAHYETVYHAPDGNDIYYESRVTPRLMPGSDEVIGLTVSARDITLRKQIEVQGQHLATLEERERIGRELHDDLGQVMGYVTVQTQTALSRLEDGETQDVQAILNQLVQVTQEAHADVRQYILGVRTSSREPAVSTSRQTAGLSTGVMQPPADFLTALEGYLDTLRQRYGLETLLSLPEDWRDDLIAPEVGTQLLRIIQEALTNVHKHSGVDKARLLFTRHAEVVQLIIEDDGCGFTTPSPRPSPGAQLTGEGDMDQESESLIPDFHFGLMIMRERAQVVDGHLEVRSVPGEGTRIIVTLPCAIPQTLTPSSEIIRGIRVLLVDDHPLYLEGLRNLLAARGVQVVGMANDGLEAQSLARDLRPDLILMDVHMPHCDGLEATKRIKEELPRVKIVMLTVAADSETLFGALKNGASGYLLKSLEGGQFFKLLASVLDGETVLSPELASRVLAEFTPPEAELPSKVEEGEPLTSRQQEVLELITQGFTNKGIAAALHITERTVKFHVSQILERLHLKRKSDLVNHARGRRGGF